MAPSPGRNQRRLLQEASKKRLACLAQTRQRGAGDLAQPFHTTLPQVTPPPPRHQRQDLSHHSHLRRKHGDPGPAPAPVPRVCVRASVRPSACRETVPVTRSKQARGRQGPGYATFGVMTASLLFTLDNSLF